MSENDTTRQGLYIESGSRHYKIMDAEDEIVFRTTNKRDAEKYLDLVEENQRMRRLLRARGIAPHRIYLLSEDEEHRGEAASGKHLANEVVIVAKADDANAVVVRRLEDGREEIVDLEEIEPIRGGAYLQASDMTEALAHVVARIPKDFDPEAEDDEQELASVAAARQDERAEQIVDDWMNLEEDDQHPDERYDAALSEETEDALIFRAEVTIEEGGEQ